MKKKIFGGIAVLAFAAIVGLNVKMNSQNTKMADLSLNNVEALAEEFEVNVGGSKFTCEKNSGICKDTQYATYKGTLVK